MLDVHIVHIVHLTNQELCMINCWKPSLPTKPPNLTLPHCPLETCNTQTSICICTSTEDRIQNAECDVPIKLCNVTSHSASTEGIVVHAGSQTGNVAMLNQIKVLLFIDIRQRCRHNTQYNSQIHNTQIHNTQIHKYTNTQIHKYTNTQIHKYTISLTWQRTRHKTV